MAGSLVSEGGHRGGRRALDSDLNMIPMIDLLMVTISFLLITAVWTHMGRIEAKANVPGGTEACEAPCTEARELHVQMREPNRFTLTWKENGKDLRPPTDIARVKRVEQIGAVRVVHFPGLEEGLRAEWEQMGVHKAAGDRRMDRVVLHTDDASPYAEIVGAMDAVQGVTRSIQAGPRTETASAFQVTFATK